MLIDCYTNDNKGKPLTALLAEDWRLFDDSKMDDAHAKELLAEVLDDGEIVRKSFVPIELPINETRQRWNDLRDEMMHRNRWFLDEPIDLDNLAEMLDLLATSTDELNNSTNLWYRARLLTDREHLPLDEMGAPPSYLAGHGRANPAGIPYLYLGSTEKTAISEIRPHTGETACIATFQVPPIKAVDLRDPRKSASPFILENVEQIMSLRSGLPLLEHLGEELTKPIQPRSAAFEYIPSQYLCEFIKKRGYNGVLYRSSVSDGVNLALFSPDLASAVKVENFRVDSVTVNIASVNEDAPSADKLPEKQTSSVRKPWSGYSELDWQG
ncbi:RES family NAD+ phosphorylase [Trueperella pyogenes]|uniref:RES family NAD+ phosphorylase n=1 Tax=Trueperella pyogenes TaxID=1661 RepID=UPI00345DBF03